MNADRRAAFAALCDIEQGAYSNFAVNRQVRRDGVVSVAFVRELVYGVLRHAYALDYNIDRLLKNPGRRLRPGIRTLLRMGMYQLSHMDGVAHYAAVDETVGLAARQFRGQQGFVNAILRTHVRNGCRILYPETDDDIGDLSIRYSTHRDIVQLWMASYGRTAAEKMLESQMHPAPLTVRTNRLKIGRGDLIKRLEQSGFVACEGEHAETAVHLSGGELIASRLYAEGLCSVQDESSQIAVELLDPAKGERVLDLCAAPGGKSCACAERMLDTGTVCAFDIHPGKLRAVAREADRLQLTIVRTAVADSTIHDEALAGTGDAVWVDAPCSGLGVLRRKPELKLRSCRESVASLVDLQRALLSNAARYVCPGGRLMYTTCTVNPAENEDAIEAFLAEQTGFELEYKKQWTTWEHGTDGFFIGLMRKRND